MNRLFLYPVNMWLLKRKKIDHRHAINRTHKFIDKVIHVMLEDNIRAMPSYTMTKIDANKLNLNRFLRKYAPYSEITLFGIYALILMTPREDRMKKMTWHLLSVEFINFLLDCLHKKEKFICINITNSLSLQYCNNSMNKRPNYNFS